MISFKKLKRLALTLKNKNIVRRNLSNRPNLAYSLSSKDSIKRIMVFGDSNSFRSDSNSACWPTLLEKRALLNLNVFNESYDGRAICHDTGEKNGLCVIGKKLKTNLPLDYVIVMLGTYDVKSKYGPPNTFNIIDGMRQILDCIKKHGGGAKPNILTPSPMEQVISGELAGGQSRIPFIAAEYRLLAMRYQLRLVDLHAILDTTTDLEPDMIHLNAVGRRKVANAVWANLQGLNPPPYVKGFACMHNSPNFILACKAVNSDTLLKLLISRRTLGHPRTQTPAKLAGISHLLHPHLRFV